ncbi:MAG: SMP-30/gluconolactonase/LRE family protein, partial [Mariniphaga sp.]|nr:SMP-30/gluconolactonase/LRE family protein [Mariniphaga sp.]
WIDITPGQLHRLDLKSGNKQNWSMGSMIGTVVLDALGGLVVALESGIYHFEPKKGMTQLFDFPENSEKGNRFNDGKCDPAGRLWVGTMNKKVKPNDGKLYCFDGRSVDVKLENLTISNGMAWSADLKCFYFIDTADYAVSCFDFDNVRGNISNRRKVIDVPVDMGGPDGMTIDHDGMLWIAHWGGACIARWNPNNGQLLEIVKVPAPHVTSCIFGGEDLRTLFISTAIEGLTKAQLDEFPLSGSLFSYIPEVAGIEPCVFKSELKFKH